MFQRPFCTALGRHVLYRMIRIPGRFGKKRDVTRGVACILRSINGILERKPQLLLAEVCNAGLDSHETER